MWTRRCGRADVITNGSSMFVVGLSTMLIIEAGDLPSLPEPRADPIFRRVVSVLTWGG